MCYFKYINVKYDSCGHTSQIYDSTHRCMWAIYTNSICPDLPCKIILREEFAGLCGSCK